MAGVTSSWVSRDGGGNGTKPKGGRLALAAFMEWLGPDPFDVKLGVFADSQSPVVTGRPDMKYDIRQAIFSTNPTDSPANGPVIGANDATLTVDTTPAPGSNSRIDVIWVRQHVVSADGGSDEDTNLEFGVTQGLAAGSPVVPDVPDGALALASVPVPSDTVATNTLTFTRLHEWVGTRGFDPTVHVDKFANQSFPTSAGALTDDNELQFPVEAGGIYEVQIRLFPVYPGGDPSLHQTYPVMAMSFPSGVVQAHGHVICQDGTQAYVYAVPATASGAPWTSPAPEADALMFSCQITVLLHVGATGGTAKMQFKSSGNDNFVLSAGSYLTARRVG